MSRVCGFVITYNVSCCLTILPCDALQAKREREAKAKHEQFEEIFEDVLEGMVKRQGIVADVQITLDRKERENKQFRQQLFNEWQTQVYDKIQNRIMTKVDAIQTKELKAQIRCVAAADGKGY